MSSLNIPPPVKEEAVWWTEKEALVKEEKEEEDVTVKQEVEVEAVTVKEEEKDVSVKEEEEEEDVTVKEEADEEEGEITVTLEEEEEVGDLFNTRAVKKWNSKATEHDISRAVGDHLKPLVEPAVVFTTPPRLQQAGKVGLIHLFVSVVESFDVLLISKCFIFNK
ncbi:gelsolin-related protein of 125 kDa-like isoform X4 [Salvelinus sp. IW2-2015]|uniref:gelsolin-related protein of 125 kDa-like isoform X4 n=1 Tax=Salvelinus sp. IW2-2015 TaxID=2691554 RepID=UPI0038D4A32C